MADEALLHVKDLLEDVKLFPVEDFLTSSRTSSAAASSSGWSSRGPSFSSRR